MGRSEGTLRAGERMRLALLSWPFGLALITLLVNDHYIKAAYPGFVSGKLSDIAWGTIPFHLLMFVLLVMLVFWPDIALWLPQHMSAPP